MFHAYANHPVRSELELRGCPHTLLGFTPIQRKDVVAETEVLLLGQERSAAIGVERNAGVDLITHNARNTGIGAAPAAPVHVVGIHAGCHGETPLYRQGIGHGQRLPEPYSGGGMLAQAHTETHAKLGIQALVEPPRRAAPIVGSPGIAHRRTEKRRGRSRQQWQREVEIRGRNGQRKRILTQAVGRGVHKCIVKIPLTSGVVRLGPNQRATEQREAKKKEAFHDADV